MSIKIIKKGNLKHITYRFTCLKCGCIFEADGYDVVTDYITYAETGQKRLAKCPCCGRFVSGVEIGECSR